jgi:hypothetical protein
LTVGVAINSLPLNVINCPLSYITVCRQGFLSITLKVDEAETTGDELRVLVNSKV